MKDTILIAPNSFKGNLSASKIASIVADKLIAELGDKFNIVQFPLTDGGDGFNQIIKELLKTESIFINVDFPYESNEKLEVPVEYDANGKILYVESASILGLKIVPEEKRNPLSLSSKGLGQVLKYLKNIAQTGKMEIDEVVIGLGGSATQDLGLGALSEFGLRFFHYSKYIPIEPKFFARADRISYNAADFEFPFRIKFVLDVNNPLLGENGSNFIYAKQKGANDEVISYLEKGFINILRLLHFKETKSLSGAAGGIAAGFKILVNKSEVISAEDFILEYLGLNNFTHPEFVITGEGKLDDTTFNGKAPAVVINKFQKSTKRIFFICGSSELKNYDDKLTVVNLSQILGTVDSAKRNTKKGLKVVSEQIAKKISEE
jgi:glycerate kinase